MKYQIDKTYLIDCFKDLVAAPSPVGYHHKLKPVIEAYAEALGEKVTYDNKDTAYITLDGEDNSKTVLISAHADTIGLIVRRIDGNGMIRISSLGGINLPAVEGETVTVHTRSGKEYTGLFVCESYSTHVFSDALTKERTDQTMMIILDEDVHSKEDVNALGIRNGDVISVAPRCEYTENGYLKSRFIDDKGAMACCFAMLKYMKDNHLKPRYRTLISFPYFEEVGLGGTYIPPEVSEFLAVDIGLVGPDCDGTERSVSICAKDVFTTYSYDFTNRLIEYAKRAECDYAVDIFYRYGSDASAAVKAGNDVRFALCGMGTYCTHGMERTHIDGLCNTANLLIAYAVDLKE